MELNEQQKQFADMLQKSIDDNTFATETLNPLQLRAVDKLIKEKVIKSKPLKELYNERVKAREDIAKAETIKKDPMASYFELDESKIPGADFLLSGRSSAVLAGDLGASFTMANYMRDKVADAYKKTDMTGLKLTRGKKFFFEKMADKLPGRYKFLGGALRLAGKTLDLPERALRSPLGRAELGVATAGTAGAGAGSITYDLMDKAVG